MSPEWTYTNKFNRKSNFEIVPWFRIRDKCDAEFEEPIYKDALTIAK